jgi:2-phospho-L-lactate transferase/gluconeogenesis factor (CofD/UPF0052 family)
MVLQLALGAAAASSAPGAARTPPAAAAAAAALAGLSFDNGSGSGQQPHQPQSQQQQQQQQQRLLVCPSLVVFSGGTAFNSVAPALRHLTTSVAHVLPVSDDGGSTAEIVRVLGGPAVGDIRSRCLRLADDEDAEARAVKRLLAHRLPGGGGGGAAGGSASGGGGVVSAAEAANNGSSSSNAADRARLEWYDVVEGRHPLWQGVSEPYKHVIRAFLLHFHTQIMAQAAVLASSDGPAMGGGAAAGGAPGAGARPPPTFNFANGSVGNFFFAGARTFFRSLESAVFLFSRVARIPEGSLVLPAICTEERITLGAELEDGSVIRGQNAISHPPPLLLLGAAAAGGGGGAAAAAEAAGSGPSAAPRTEGGSPARVAVLSGELEEEEEDEEEEEEEGGGEGGTARRALPLTAEPLAADYSGQLVVDKRAASCPPLPSPIRRVFYLSREGTGREHEVAPRANPRVTEQLSRCDAVVYAMGSLYTSICPALCLEGVGEAVAAREGAAKVLVLNGTHDRETSLARGRGGGGGGAGVAAHGVVGAATANGNSAAASLRPSGPMTASDVVRAVVDALNRSRPPRRRRTSTAQFAAAAGGGSAAAANAPGPPALNNPPSAYVTALIVPRGGEIEVDRDELAKLGVTTVVEVDATVEEEEEEDDDGGEAGVAARGEQEQKKQQQRAPGARPPSSSSPRPPTSGHRRVLYDSEALVYAIGRVIYGLEGGEGGSGGGGGGGSSAGGGIGGVVVPGGISLSPPPPPAS